MANIPQILVINKHDYTRWIQDEGYNWTRNDLDSENTLRTKDTLMRRDKLGTKRKLSYKMMPMPTDILAQLDDDLSTEFFTATYLDPHGQQTRTFYCSSMPANVKVIYKNGQQLWDGVSFNIIER